MKKLTIIIIFNTLHLISLTAQSATWTVAEIPWKESFGSQRAVLEISKAAISAEVNILWRRHDPHPDQRRILAIEAITGDTVPNLDPLEINNENCHLKFGPIERPGIYYLYYLPFAIVEGWGYFGKDYLKPDKTPDPLWMGQNSMTPVTQAKVLRIESRTSFDNFFPMEIIPTKSERMAFLKKFPDQVLYFPETREYPIRMRDEIPLKWILSEPASQFSGQACRNEYFAFQIGVFAAQSNITGLSVITGSLCLKGNPSVPGIDLTCFNTRGTDPYGIPFIKKLNIPVGGVQALWIGADVTDNALPGTYSGIITITADGIPDKKITVTLKVAKNSIPDRGDNEPWRHSRLRWLNSTAGSDGIPVAPYNPLRQSAGRKVEVAGHLVNFAETGLPESIVHNGKNLLASPIELAIISKGLKTGLPVKMDHSELTAGKFTQSAHSTLTNQQTRYRVQMDYDGYISTQVVIKNISKNEPLILDDVNLSIPLPPEKAAYMIGMGLPGCAVPFEHEAKWMGPSDSFWIGDADGGIWCELRGSSYHGPLLNLYHPAPPVSWNNGGKGGMRIIRDSSSVTARVYSGPRSLNPGDSIQFEWAILITPVKEINTRGQFTDRYYHNGGKPAPEQEDFDAGVKIINIHHANEYNPFINYPFLAVDEMRSFVDSMHAIDKKVKIYYTVRELTNHAVEIWALRSLGYEILADGQGGGYPWLREHFIDGYTPQWYQHFPDGRVDASILSAPGDSRWLNYYIEGLSWLVKNVNIDGLYLDDVTFDRRILQRMKRVMDQAKPGCIIDLHSNTGFSVGPANQYAEFFPYVDKLWFGESFKYDQMPAENWLVEVSGIPFGLMGDMLQGGGNRWLGMVFGMTVRYPWTTEGVLCDPRPVWKIWDEFGLRNSRMSGFWDTDCPVKTNCPDVRATAFIKQDKVLIAIGNFSDSTQLVQLSFDWKTLGINPDRFRMRMPEIENFQSALPIEHKSFIKIEGRKGKLIFLEKIH